MYSVSHHYRHARPGVRTFCHLLLLVASVGGCVMAILGIICLASTGRIGYCSVMSIGGYISLLSVGAAMALFCCIFMCCVACCADAAEHVPLVGSSY
jgi:hypothetical protein